MDSKVDALVTAGTEAAVAAKRGTSTIPIIMAIVSDPVGLGLIGSLARPGGNVTGVADLDVEQSGKRLELLKEVVPGLARVAIVWKAGHPKEKEALHEAETAAKALGLRLLRVGVREPGDFPGTFSTMIAGHAEAFIVVADTMFTSHRTRLVDLAATNRLPAIFWRREFAEAGGLMSYGSDYGAQYRRAAEFMDKILKGAKPADLPVEQPTKFELIINLKTAKALGLNDPPRAAAAGGRSRPVMERRTVISTLAAGAIALPLIARAQPPIVPVVGLLSSRLPGESATHAAAFNRGLSDTGYAEGRNVAIKYRWANGAQHIGSSEMNAGHSGPAKRSRP